MEYVKQYAFSICAAGLTATICYMILPNSGISKVMKTAISVFFLSALLSPWLLDIDIGDEIERYSIMDFEEQYDALSEETDRYIIDQFEVKIKELILSELTSIDVDPVNVIVSIETGKDDTLFVDKVDVYLRQEDMRYQADVSVKVKNITSCQPQIYATEVE